MLCIIYIGELYDPETNLSYLNARYYESNREQFLSQDPVFWEVKQDFKNPQTLNSYSYAANSPIVLKDPQGRTAVLGIFLTNPVGLAVGATAAVLGTAYAMYQSLDYDSAQSGTLKDSSSPFEFMSYPSPQDPDEPKPPKDNLSWWKYVGYAVLLGTNAIYEFTKEGKMLPQQQPPKESSKPNQSTNPNSSQSNLQNNKPSTSGGGSSGKSGGTNPNNYDASYKSLQAASKALDRGDLNGARRHLNDAAKVLR